MFYIGVDPGSKGGLAAIREDGNVCYALPYSDDNLKMLSEVYNHDSTWIVEQVHAMPGQGVTSMFNFGRSFGYILGVLEAHEIPYQLVSPQKWQNSLSIHSKDESVSHAKRLFPKANLKPTERSRKDSDGIADALNLAEYGRRLYKR